MTQDHPETPRTAAGRQHLFALTDDLTFQLGKVEGTKAAARARLAILAIEAEAAALALPEGMHVCSCDQHPAEAAARQVTELLGHWPDIGVDQSDSTWLECSCGWDSSKKGSGDWVAHLERALLAGDKAEAPL